MNDEEEWRFLEALQTGKTLLVEGHSGNRLRFYHDALPFVSSKAGIALECTPVSVLVSSLGGLCAYLRRTDSSRHRVFFVNTDLCSSVAVRDVLHHYHGVANKLQVFSLRKVYHSCDETLKLLEVMEQKSESGLGMVKFNYRLADALQYSLIIPEKYEMADAISRVCNSVDAALANRVTDVHSYFSKWIPDSDKGLWTDIYVFERVLPPDPYSNSVLRLQNFLQSLLKRTVVLIDVSDIREGVERVALCLPILPKERHYCREVVESIVKSAKRMGWILIAQTATPSSFDMPNRAIHLWCGARVVFKNGCSGTVKGFDRSPLSCNKGTKWPVVMLDGESGGNIVLPSVTCLSIVSNLRVSELPLSYDSNTVTVEELFLAPRSSLTGRSFLLRPSLFLGRLSLLRCAFASLPSLSHVSLTSPLPWNQLVV